MKTLLIAIAGMIIAIQLSLSAIDSVLEDTQAKQVQHTQQIGDL